MILTFKTRIFFPLILRYSKISRNKIPTDVDQIHLKFFRSFPLLKGTYRFQMTENYFEEHVIFSSV